MRKIGLTGMSEKAPGIAVARCIKTGCPDVNVVAFGEPMDAGMYIDVDSSYVVEPYDIDAIVKISSAKGVSALIPNMDDDVEAFAESRDVFYEYGNLHPDQFFLVSLQYSYLLLVQAVWHCLLPAQALSAQMLSLHLMLQRRQITI